MSDESSLKKRKFIFSPLWIMPLLAIIITSWIGINAYLEAGKVIHITFKSGDNLVENKTPLIYRGLEIGIISDIKIGKKTPEEVNVSVKLKKDAEILAKEGSRFWVVKPRISLKEISGLETIISGFYIAVKPPSTNYKELKKLKDKTSFVGENEEPSQNNIIDGKKIKFWAKNKGSITEGTGIYFRDFKIGEVQSAKLLKSNHRVIFEATIYKKYVSLMSKNYFFWNEGIANFNMSGGELNLHFGSIESLFKGKIQLGLIEDQLKMKDSMSKLYQSKAQAKKDFIKNSGAKRVLLRINHNDRVGENEPVFYKKIQVGQTGQFYIKDQTDHIYLPLVIYKDYKHLLGKRSVFFPANTIDIGFDQMKFSLNLPSVKEVVSGGVQFKNIDKIQGNRIERGKVYRFFSSGVEIDNYIQKYRAGLRINLTSRSRKSLEKSSPLLFRQFQIGEVEEVELKPTGDKVNIKVLIYPKFAHLIRKNSKFWSVSGIKATIGVFDGVEIEANSLKSIIKGGINVATPTEYKSKVKNGHNFNLFLKADEDWLEWSPTIKPN